MVKKIFLSMIQNIPNKKKIENNEIIENEKKDDDEKEKNL
jgi:hypothetical protein